MLNKNTLFLYECLMLFLIVNMRYKEETCFCLLKASDIMLQIQVLMLHLWRGGTGTR